MGDENTYLTKIISFFARVFYNFLLKMFSQHDNYNITIILKKKEL